MGGKVELFRERVCGIDIGKATVVACVRIAKGWDSNRDDDADVRDDHSAVDAVVGLAAAEGVQLVGMESTRVYRRQPFYLFEIRPQSPESG
jgi:transposase